MLVTVKIKKTIILSCHLFHAVRQLVSTPTKCIEWRAADARIRSRSFRTVWTEGAGSLNSPERRLRRVTHILCIPPSDELIPLQRVSAQINYAAASQYYYYLHLAHTEGKSRVYAAVSSHLHHDAPKADELLRRGVESGEVQDLSMFLPTWTIALAISSSKG